MIISWGGMFSGLVSCYLFTSMYKGHSIDKVNFSRKLIVKGPFQFQKLSASPRSLTNAPRSFPLPKTQYVSTL